VLTNPGKRGTFGYTGTLIGGQLQAVAADFESDRVAAKQDLADHRQKMGDRKAFKSTAHGVDFFDTQEHVAASRVHSWDDTCRIQPPDPVELMNPKERATARAATYKAWKPNNPVKSGEQGWVVLAGFWWLLAFSRGGQCV
jgi:hypothetical protein